MNQLSYLFLGTAMLSVLGLAGCVAMPAAHTPPPTPDRSKPPIQQIEVGDISVGRISGAWLIQLQDAGHGVQYRYPGLMARLIRDFLSAS